MAFLGRFEAPDTQGCDSVAPRRRLAWRILYALVVIALALWFGHGAEAGVLPDSAAHVFASATARERDRTYDLGGGLFSMKASMPAMPSAWTKLSEMTREESA